MSELVETKPISLPTEQHLIGAVLRGGRSSFEQVKDFILPEMFFSIGHQSVWQGLFKVYDAGLQLDTVIVGDEMERMLKMGELEEEWGNGIINGRTYLARLRESGDPRNIESYAEQVQDYHIKRHLLNFSGKIAYWSANGRRGKDIMSDVESEFSKISIFSAQDEYTVPIGVGVSEAYDWIDKAARGEIVGVPTGFKEVDKLLGSMIAGNVYIVAGRPKKGKTGFLLSVAYNVAKKQKKRVGIFSLEMSRLQVSQRLISMESQIDLHRMILGELEEKEWAMLTHAVEVTADLPIVINDLSSININQIRRTARKIKASGGLDLLIVDYIQLASGVSEGKAFERRDLEVSAVSRGLKYLARELNVPILAAAQLSRNIETRADKKPILSDLRESGSLEQDAYAVMFLHKEKEDSDVNELIVAAHRNGPTGTAELLFRNHLARFEDLSYRTQDWQTSRKDMG